MAEAQSEVAVQAIWILGFAPAAEAAMAISGQSGDSNLAKRNHTFLPDAHRHSALVYR